MADLETFASALSGKHLGAAGNDFVIAEWRDPGGPAKDPPRLIAPLHVHFEDDEAWYVLEGQLCVRRGDEVVTARAGSGVMVPAGMPHTFWNPGPGPTRYLVVMTHRIHSLIAELHRTGRSTPMAEVFKEHASELLDGSSLQGQ